jgi:FkbM family methyltransferase
MTIYISDRWSLNVLEEVLVNGEYAMGQAGSARVIVDLGANIGVASLYFRALAPQARIVAVEPDPRAFAALMLNDSANDAGLECVHAAVTGVPGAVTLRSERGSWVSHIVPSDAHSGDAVSTSGLTLDELFTGRGLTHVDLLKIDIEGAEWDVLRGAQCLDAVSRVVGEIHKVPGQESVDRFLTGIANTHGFVTPVRHTGRRFLLERKR